MTINFDEATQKLTQFAFNAELRLARFNPRDNNTVDSVVCHFVNRQLNHAKAMALLGRHTDAQLVARSMIEGYAILAWILAIDAEREERTQLWLTHSTVAALSSLEWWEARGGKPHAAGAALRAKASKLPRKLKKKPDVPFAADVKASEFRSKLFANGITDVIRTPLNTTKDERELRTVLSKNYDLLSSWHHWDSTGVIDRGLTLEDRYKDPEQSSGAAMIAAHVMMNTLTLAFDYFSAIRDGLAPEAAIVGETKSG